jgi:membrane associated rhomboid family serine protease
MSMSNPNRSGRFIEGPNFTVQLLLVANIAIYGLCASQAGEANIPTELLFRYGAMYSGAIQRGEYWRFITAGFLHAGPIHIFGNMLCLVLWGGLLEKRVGALYFIFIYGCGLVAGSIISDITHTGPYLSVGASGAISAVLGALLSLRLLGAIGLPWNFFLINIGLNIALAVGVARVDWGAHLGGFAAGMLACVFLDVLERVFARVLRCKFPEFVKVNGFLVFVIVVAYCWANSTLGLSQQTIWALAAVATLVCIAAIKVTDLVLSMKKGLAVVVVAFALANPAMVLLWSAGLARALGLLCIDRSGPTNTMAATICANIDGSIVVVALAVAAFTMLLYWPQFARGMSDVGFVTAGFQGERARRQRL